MTRRSHPAIIHLTQAVKTIQSLRREKHDYCDEDGWYSCPKADNYDGNDTECNCGLQEQQATVDKAIWEIQEAIGKL